MGEILLLSLILVLPQPALAAQGVLCNPPTPEQQQKLFVLADSSTKSLQKFSGANAPLKEAAGCLTEYLKGRELACNPRPEGVVGSEDQREAGVGDNAGGCTYLSHMYQLNSQNSREMLEAHNRHIGLANNILTCIQKAQLKLFALKPSPQEKKKFASDLPKLPGETQDLGRISDKISQGESADAKVYLKGYEEAEARKKTLKERMATCGSQQISIPKIR